MNPLLLKAGGWAIAAALLVSLKVQYDRNQRAIGAMGERLKVADSTLAVTIAAGARLAVKYDEDTAAFSTELAEWKAIKQRVRLVAKVETLPPRTVPGPERIVVRDSTRPPTLEEILNAADATIQRCSTALGTCESRISNLQQQLTATETQRDAYRRLMPSGFKTVTRTARDVGIGIGLTILYDALVKK